MYFALYFFISALSRRYCMTKKRLPLLILLLIPLALAICACGNSAPSDLLVEIEPDDIPLALSVLHLTMCTGADYGNYYPFGAVLARVVNDASSYLEIDVHAGGDFAENMERLATGKAQLALVQNDMLSDAFYAAGAWQDKPPVTDITPLMTLYPEICQLVAGGTAGINSVGDLKGRRVAIGEEGTALRGSALRILKEYGLSEEDIEAWPVGFDEAAQAMREKTLDAFFLTAGTPNKGMMDLRADREIVIIGLEAGKIAALMEKYPFYTPYTLSEGDYSFLTEPLETLAVRATLAAASSLSEQAAYDIVKAIIENSDKVALAHTKGMYVSAQEAVRGLPLELHAGARRYFTEIKAQTETAAEDDGQERALQ
jgi:TRAP transporter TAXI family solute receptor